MAFESPLAVLYNSEGNPLAVSQSMDVLAEQPGIVIMGSGSQGWEPFYLDEEGALYVTGTLGIVPPANQNVTVTNQPTVDQGDSGVVTDGWYVRLTDGTEVIGVESAPVWTTGSVTVTNFPTEFDVNVLGTASVNVENFPSEFDVTVLNTASVIVENTVDVNVQNFPTEFDVVVTNTASVNVENFPSEFDVTVLGTASVNVENTVTTREIASTTATVSGAYASTTPITILAANADRKGASFFMDGNSTAFLKLGASPSSTSFTTRLINGAYYELPYDYTGDITVVFSNNNNAAQLLVTEFEV